MTAAALARAEPPAPPRADHHPHLFSPAVAALIARPGAALQEPGPRSAACR